MKTQLLIAAAGMGVRLGGGGPKALVDIEGKPMLVRTLTRFAPLRLDDGAVVVVSPGHEALFDATLKAALPGTSLTVVAGGAERQISVANGLDALAPDTEIVVIHDAARPFVSQAAVQASVEAAEACGAATVAVPTIDTVLKADAEQFLIETPDRRSLWACQTPQTFLVDVIRRAHARASAEDHLGTDDASLVKRMGEPVKLVEGTPTNFKVTTPLDLAMARFVVREGLV
ncbi:MAG: 2-C-methyl-D-erythritol 4-phosphate cytidylyltransferase [Nitrospiraceae bacterium]|nr:2-C-methyl-D-erythritol 4-phosphate cytidylyltransferase [Nitrospiraceae bacterium]